MEKRPEKHFVLIHGACHGAWCWYKVATLLRSAGHRVTTLDMAAAGVHPKRVDEVRSLSDHLEPLMEFMESLPVDDDQVVLVGHSAGGLSISVAMEKYPNKISIAVFVTAYMPGPDLTVQDLYQKNNEGEGVSWMDCQTRFDNGLDKPPTSMIFGPEFLLSKLYKLSPPEDFTLATLLMRPYPTYVDEAAFSKENYGSVRRVYIVVEGDEILKESFQRWSIAKNPVDEVKSISGSDHMVMISRPQELSSCLLQLVS